LQESETNLYAIGVGVRQPEMSPDGGPPERVGSEILTSLAEESGGRYFEAADPRELPKTMSRIDIRYQYVLGFKPLSADGKYHRWPSNSPDGPACATSTPIGVPVTTLPPSCGRPGSADDSLRTA